jgi:hypothetical protein
MNAKELAEKHGLTLSLVRVHENPNMEDSAEKMINYLATIIQQQGTHSGTKTKSFQIHYSTGLGWVAVKSTGNRAQNVTYSPRYDDFIVNEKGRNYMSNNYNMLLRFKYKIQEPKITDILECLMMDFNSIESESFVFESWAESLGYSPDSIKAKKSFDSIVESRSNFIRVFGMNVYNDLIKIEEE